VLEVLASSHGEATIALDFANVEQRVVPFAGLPMRSLLVHRNSEFLQSTSPRWAGAFFDADGKAQGSLIRTLRAIADADLTCKRPHDSSANIRTLSMRASSGSEL
jgi:hypothetical protein